MTDNEEEEKISIRTFWFGVNYVIHELQRSINRIMINILLLQSLSKVEKKCKIMLCEKYNQ